MPRSIHAMALGIDPSNVVFDDAIPQQGKCVPYRVLESKRSGDLKLLVQLRAGWRFDVETHSYREEMLVRSGHGIFREEGIYRPYRPGDLLVVPASVEHAFVQVDEDTILEKHMLREAV